MHEALVEVAPALDPERPRYLMGVGTPRDLVIAIGAGVDMFDCVLPTRNARNGQALTRRGPVVIKQARYKDDPRPIDELCACDCCAGGYSRAYLRHLYLAGEILCLRLLSLHNLHFYGELAAAARAAIGARRFSAWARRLRCRRLMREGLSGVTLVRDRDPCPATRSGRSARSCSSESWCRSRSSTPPFERRSARSRPRPSRRVLVEEGAVDEVQALRALSEQHGIPGIDLTQIAIVLEQLDVVPREVAETHRILPVLVRGDRIFLAMADPHDKRVIDELEFVTGKKVYPYIAVHSTLVKTIAAAYDAKAAARASLPRAARAGGDAAAARARSRPTCARRQRQPRPSRDRRRRRPRPPPRRALAAPLRARRAPRPCRARPSGRVDEAVGERRRSPRRCRRASSASSARRSRASRSLPDDLRVARRAGGRRHGDRRRQARSSSWTTRRRSASSLRRLLTQKGHRVIEADRGLLALRLVKDHMPDLIILDAMLPELHGFDIARRIKGSAKYGRIPIIMISAVYRGWRIAEDLKQNYGVEEYLEKPFRITDAARRRAAPAHARRRAARRSLRAIPSTCRPRPRRPSTRASPPTRPARSTRPSST